MNINAMLSPTEENLTKFVENGPYTTDKLTVRSVKLYSMVRLAQEGHCYLNPTAMPPLNMVS